MTDPKPKSRKRTSKTDETESGETHEQSLQGMTIDSEGHVLDPAEAPYSGQTADLTRAQEELATEVEAEELRVKIKEKEAEKAEKAAVKAEKKAEKAEPEKTAEMISLEKLHEQQEEYQKEMESE